MTVIAAIVHAGLAAAWVGGMAYSLFVVQPKLRRYFGPDEDGREALTMMIAAGNRWKVIGLIGVIAATGAFLLWLTSSPLWIHLVKVVLLLAATAIFWYVSWRHWPRRVFATSTELPAFQRRLRLLASTMLALTATAFALGIAASHL
ncbi:hypothetical protein OG394_23555 [Kribbella sp. NBC_01245]|uniref:hypothetical protein n=1 Tax=Kribbella sp. NBC_01245 TaxID=2903578 RepID=UPI002E2C3BDF|nr:hypothetical protein [Kribbella sp. NBC_01245]